MNTTKTPKITAILGPFHFRDDERIIAILSLCAAIGCPGRRQYTLQDGRVFEIPDTAQTLHAILNEWSEKAHEMLQQWGHLVGTSHLDMYAAQLLLRQLLRHLQYKLTPDEHLIVEFLKGALLAKTMQVNASRREARKQQEALAEDESSDSEGTAA